MDSRQGCAAMLAGLTWAAPTPAQPSDTVSDDLELTSCVSGSPPLRVARTAERAVLDAADRQRFQQAAQARYPLYQRSGLAPAQVLMLRRGGQWQYVTLWAQGPSGLCFSAVFAAERFDFTPRWIERYRPRAGALDD
jgi:hypothetical protein